MSGVRNKKIRRVTFLLLAMLYFSALPAQAQYGGGSGEPNDPYLIYTAEQMNVIGLYELDWDKNFKLMADIDLSVFDGKDGRPEFNKIAPDRNPFKSGYQGTPFAGVFDGNGHTISNYTYTFLFRDNIGLFGSIRGENAEIRDLGLINPNVDAGTGGPAGSLAASLSIGAISNCHVKGGSVSGNGVVGGLVGHSMDDSTITNCYSTASVSGDWGIGGLVGQNYGSITSSYSTGVVGGNGIIGGLVGENYNGHVLNCYSMCTVSGNWGVGGLVGRNDGDVIRCYSTGTVIGKGDVGGLVGIGDPDRSRNCVWDVQTSGLTISAGGMALTTVEMMDPEILGLNGLGGNPNWILDSGRDYPRLVWEGTAGQMIPEPVVDWLDGVGTPEDPFQIEKADQLLLLHKYSLLWNKHFILNADIDLDPNLPGRVILEQAVIPTFEGSFFGNGYEISNLQIEGEDYLGFFGKLIKGSVVMDLGLKNISVKGTGSDIGGLGGRNSGGHVLNSYSTGEFIGSNRVGGLLGDNSGGHVLNCYSMCIVNGNWGVGGLLGDNSGVVTVCYSDSTVCGESSIGGLVGDNDGDVTYCYSTSPVCGSGQSVGGLVGSGHPEEVINSFWDIQISGQQTSAGGIGKTTAEMQMAETFLEAGWDFVGEAENGTEDIWLIIEGQDYPKLKELPEGPRLWPHLAFCPDPQNGAIDVIRSVVLYWAPANPPIQHDIYLGEDKQAVANATTLSLGVYRGRQPGDVTSYDPGILELGKTYYWRIDEVNEDDPNNLWKGSVWSFTTANFLVVDNFESYNDIDPPDPQSNRIFDTWIDGFDNPEINGSVVSSTDMSAPWGRTIAHSGFQSMWYSYDNGVGISEATAHITNLAIGRDWTIGGVAVLSLWSRGYAANAAERMFVALNGTAVVYHDDPVVTQKTGWNEWVIDLQEFADQGVDLTNVDTISIGFGDKNNPVAGGRGEMWFDDIRLYRPDAEPAL